MEYSQLNSRLSLIYFPCSWECEKPGCGMVNSIRLDMGDHHSLLPAGREGCPWTHIGHQKPVESGLAADIGKYLLESVVVAAKCTTAGWYIQTIWLKSLVSNTFVTWGVIVRYFSSITPSPMSSSYINICLSLDILVMVSFVMKNVGEGAVCATDRYIMMNSACVESMSNAGN